jgi:hypothetical protein
VVVVPITVGLVTGGYMALVNASRAAAQRGVQPAHFRRVMLAAAVSGTLWLAIGVALSWVLMAPF